MFRKSINGGSARCDKSQTFKGQFKRSTFILQYRLSGHPFCGNLVTDE